MPDPTGGALASHNTPEYTVSGLSRDLKAAVEDRYENIRVKGEISGFKRHGSGHLYFALKDEEAVLDAVCWRGQAAKLQIAPEDGLEVVASGRLTTYPGRSKYQMVVDRLEVAGKGALLALLDERRRRLAAEGLFDARRKKKIPFLPEVVGVITSPTGAVIKDILHRLADRFPRLVLLWPVAVQGEGAAQQVAQAIDGFNALAPGGPVPRPDVLIVARGGGSLEDLWAFNEEVVVRAAADSAIPLISAVGHETDTTLIDYAADLRAPTPTGAAEMAVPVRRDLILQVMDRERRLAGAANRLIAERRTRLEGLARGLVDPRRRVQEMAQALDDKAERLANALPNYLHRRRAQLDAAAQRLEAARLKLAGAETRRVALGRQRLDAVQARLVQAWPRALEVRRAGLDRLAGLLETLSYRQTLKRGFALVRDAHGNAVAEGGQARAGERWSVTFADEVAVPVVVEGAQPRPPVRAGGRGKDDGRQGNLL